MKSIYLYPAQSIASREKAEIRTILGSCVAVALFDPVLLIGGLNHYLLSAPADRNDATLRYASVAIPALVEQMVEQGAVRSRLKAKIYGGAAVLDIGSAGQQVGERNIEAARNILRELGIPIVEENLGGRVGRKIRLITDTFEVFHEFMGSGEGEPDITGTTSPRMRSHVRVLIVDDSMTVRQIFTRILDKDPRIEVVGVASDAFEARKLLVQEKPDVMLLDIEMPRMNGVEFLEKVMRHAPTPTIMVSSLGSNEDAAKKCLEVGAVEFVHKPSQFDPNVLRGLAESLVEKALAAASVPLHQILARRSLGSVRAKKVVATPKGGDFRSQVILIGGNAGAQYGLADLLAGLAPDSPPVVVAVSAITPFLGNFIRDLQGKCGVRLHQATEGMPLSSGQVYLAPAAQHLELQPLPGGAFKLHLDKGNFVNSQMPSATRLFESVLSASKDLSSIVAILLSGFGSDGVDALLKLRTAGARTMVAEPKGAPFGFVPGGAIRLGAVDEVLDPADMPEAIYRMRNLAVAS